MISKLIDEEILSEDLREFTIDNLVTFDIEVIQKDVNEEKLLSPISIGVGSTFAPEMYFERNSSAAADGDLMISQFMDYLEDLHSEYLARLVLNVYYKSERILRLPAEIIEVYNDLKAQDAVEELFHLKAKRSTHLRKLETILTLPCYGYNSSKFFNMKNNISL